MPKSMQPGKSVDDMIRFFAARTKSMFYHVLSILGWPDIIIQWIGLREFFRGKPMIFMGKSMVSGFDFPLNSPLDHKLGWRQLDGKKSTN